MSLKRKYLEEVNLLKNERIRRVVDAAKVEFAINGIINSKLKDVAKRAHVGEASIYRYFKDKIDMVDIVALDYWKTQKELFDDYFDKNILVSDTGLEKVKMFLNVFHVLYNDHHDFLKFVEDFENYMTWENNKDVNSSFGDLIMSIKNVFIDLFNNGIKDGTINPNLSSEKMYEFIAQVMVSTTQKLALRTGYLNVDNGNYAKECLNNTIEMFISYIKNKKSN